MNSIILKLYLFTLVFTLSKALDCNNAPSEDYCSQMTGCHWEKGDCIGSFTPKCKDCLYVFPDSHIKSELNGSIERPFLDIHEALVSIKEQQNNTIYGINFPNQKFNLSNTEIFNISAIIRPYFKEKTFKVFSTGSFTLGGSNITLQESDYHLSFGYYYFMDGSNQVNNTCILKLLDSTFYIDSGDELSQFISFEICRVYIKNVNLTGNRPQLQFSNYAVEQEYSYTQLHVDGFRVHDYDAKYEAFLIFRSSQRAYFNNCIFENIYVKNQTVRQTNYLIMSESGPVVINNSRFDNIQFNLLKHYSPNITIENTNFTNIESQNVLEFRASISSDLTNIINCNFENITIQQTVIFADSPLQFTKSTMKNIQRLSSSLESQFSRDRSGICIYFTGKKSYILESKFYQIYQSCIFVNYQGLDVTKSIFSNPQNHDFEVFHPISFVIVDQIPLYFENFREVNAQTIYFEASTFHGNQKRYTNSSAIYITNNVDYLDINVINCTFSDLSSEQGAALYLEQFDYLELGKAKGTLDVRNSFFVRCKSRNAGGVIQLQRSSELSKHAFNNSIFLENYASHLGGAISSSIGNILVSDTVFVKNSAKYAGVMSLFKGNFEVYDSIMLFNQASDLGGSLLMDFKANKSLVNNTITKSSNFDGSGSTKVMTKVSSLTWVMKTYNFLSNVNLLNEEQMNFKALLLNKNLTSYNETYTPSNISKLNLSIVPGHNLPNIIEVTFYNESNQIAEYIDDYIFKISVISETLPIQTQSLSSSKGKIYIYNQFIIRGFDDRTPFFMIHSEKNTRNLISAQQDQITIYFKLQVQECAPGDVINNNQEICQPCQKELYSFNTSTNQATCQKCPDNMICLGGANVYPEKGFYRYDNESAIAIPCLNKGACNGGIQGTQLSKQGFCEPPFTGNLCSQCEDGYVPSTNSDNCIECDANFIFYLKMAGKLILLMGIILFEIRRKVKKGWNYKEATQVGDQQRVDEILKQFDVSCSIKIILTFMQMLTIVKAINYEWNDQLSYIYGLGSTVVPSITHQFSSRCFFTIKGIDRQTTFYYQFILTILSPIFILLAMLPIFIIGYFKMNQNKQEFWKMVKISILIIVYIEQPQILLEALGLFKCRKLAPHQYYLQENLDIKCFTSSYYKWAYGLGLPILIAWGLAYPLFLYFNVRKGYKQAKEDNSQKNELIREYSFIISGYKFEKYFWEFVVILRKLVMIAIVIAIAETDKVTQGTFVFMVLSISLFVHLRYEAYANSSVAALDTMSIVAIMLMVFLGIYFENQAFKTNSIMTAPNYLAVHMMTGVGILLVFVCFIQFAILLYRGYCESVKRGISRISSKFKRSSNKNEKQQLSENSEYELDGTAQSKSLPASQSDV